MGGGVDELASEWERASVRAQFSRSQPRTITALAATALSTIAFAIA